MIWLRLTKPKPIMHANTPRSFARFHLRLLSLPLCHCHIIYAWLLATWNNVRHFVLYCLNKSSILFPSIRFLCQIYRFKLIRFSNLLRTIRMMWKCAEPNNNKRMKEQTNKYEMMRIFLYQTWKLWMRKKESNEQINKPQADNRAQAHTYTHRENTRDRHKKIIK